MRVRATIISVALTLSGGVAAAQEPLPPEDGVGGDVGVEGEVEADGEVGVGGEAGGSADMFAPPPPAVEPEPEPEAEAAPVTVTPYGLLVYNVFFNTDPLLNDDIPHAATGGDGTSLGMTLRQSRFGLKADAPVVAEALGADEVSAQLELDFFGGFFRGNNLTYTMSHPRLRVYKLQVAYGDISITAGQDWIIAAPLNPTSLNHVALPGFHRTGNLWNRLPQARADIGLGDLKITAGVLAPAGADSNAPAAGFGAGGRVSSPSETSNIPSFQARVAYEGPVRVGVSGHFGAEDFAGADHVLTGAAILDVSVPIVDLIEIKGEAFYAQNADALFSLTNGMPGDDQISFGGWGQVLVKPVDKLTLGAAFGAEKNDDTDDRNMAVYGAVIYEPAPGLKVGVEFDHLRTNTGGGADDLTGNHVNGTVMFGF